MAENHLKKLINYNKNFKRKLEYNDLIKVINIKKK